MITNFQSPNLQREIIQKKKKTFVFNFHKLIYLFSSISRPTLKLLAVIVFEISCSPNLQREIIRKKNNFFQNFNQLISSSSSIS